MKLGALALTLLVATSAFAAPPAQEPLEALLPARAQGGAIVRRHAIQPLMDFVFADADMMKEMRPFLDRTLGIDVTRLDGVALFVLDPMGQSQVAIILRMPSTSSSPLHLASAGDGGGTPLYKIGTGSTVCARTKAGLVIGDAGAVRAAVAVDRGKEPALARDSQLGKLLGTSADTVDMVVATASLPTDKTMGVEDGVFTVKKDGLVELLVHGNPTSLGLIRAIAMQGVAAGIDQMQKEKDTAMSAQNTDPAKGMGVLFAYYTLRKMAKEMTPVLDGNALSIHYQLPDLRPLYSPTLTILSLALPAAVFGESAFKKYTNKSKLSMVHAEVKRIASLVVSSVAGGKKLAALKSTEWAPQGPCCGQTDNKCALDPKAFSGATWKAIGYQPLDASAWRYRLRVDAKAKRVTVEAEGDPDCDGIVSTVSSVVSFDGGAGVVGELVDSGDAE